METLEEILDYAIQRMNEESEAGNDFFAQYWAAYKDGVMKCIKSIDMNNEDD